MYEPKETLTPKRRELYFTSFKHLTDYYEWLISGNGSPSRFGDRSGAFNGYAGPRETLKLARNGWHAGLAAMGLELPEVKPILDGDALNYNWDITGHMFDVGAYMTGEPEHWLEPQPEPSRKVVRVIINIGQLGGVSQEKINRRGAVTAGLISGLQQAGMVVEVEAVSIAECNGDRRKTECKRDVCIKFPLGTTPLDMLELAFISGHPAMLRQMLFLVREQYYTLENSGARSGGNFGTRDLPEAERKGAVYIGAAGGRLVPYSSDRGAREWIEQQIKKQQGVA